jgi:energy-coupling factor transporter ATP-binding protein EcfA2
MKKHLESLTIHQFRGISNLRLEELGSFNILVGPNNSGKTSVLEALSVYSRPLDPLAWFVTGAGREAGTASFSSGSSFAFRRRMRLREVEWLFPHVSEPQDQEAYEGIIKISSTGHYPVRRMEALFRQFEGTTDSGTLESDEVEPEPAEAARPSEQLARGADLEVDLSVRDSMYETDLFGELPKKSKKFRFWEDRSIVRRTAAGPQLPSALLYPFSNRFDRAQVTGLSKATKEGLRGKVVELVRQLDPRVKSLEVLALDGVTPEIFAEHTETGMIPIHSLGDGVRCSLVIALTLSVVADGLLLVDEIGASLHTSALKQVFRWIMDSCERSGVQLFATTHSLEAIDAMLDIDSRYLEHIVGFQFLEGKEGWTTKRYSGDLLRRMRYERGLDVR